MTHVFPHAAAPLAAPFNRQQLAALAALCDVEVWGTIPWFPGKELGRRRAIPAAERIDGLPVSHPRTPYVPGTGRALAAPLYAAALARPIFQLRGYIDAILGCWAYPDGAAAVWLGRLARAPVVVKVHGSDLNAVAARRGPRAVLRRALPAADGVVAVSRPLAAQAEALGVSPERVHLVKNGIDRQRFYPQSRVEARRRLGLAENARWILYCGHLKRSKGIEDLVRAFAKLTRGGHDVRLAIAGDGPARAACERAAAQMPGRIHVAGAQPHDAVPAWMAACDVLALPSWSEGTPNVVLEALSCGRRVVATDVGGTRDLITSDALGELVPPRATGALAGALGRAAARPYDPDEVAKRGGAGDWRDSARALYGVLSRVVDGKERARRAGAGSDAAAPGGQVSSRQVAAPKQAFVSPGGGEHG